MKKIVVAGNICIDITPAFPASEKKAPGEIFLPGKLIEVGAAEISIGGCVANTGLALKTLGADVHMIGKLGKDYYGSLILDMLKGYQADHNIIVSDDCNTTYSIILAPPGIDRIFVHYPGADNSFSYDDLDFEQIKGASLFHLGYPSIMKQLYQDGGKELIAIMKRVKELGVLTSLDMAAIDPDSEAAKTDWPPILQKLMPYVDFFLPSVEELCFMIDRNRHKEWLQIANGQDITRILSVEADIRPLAEKVIGWGGKVVLVKCGVPGIYLRTAGGSSIESLGPAFAGWADVSHFESSYVEDCFRSATGAGDTSIAAFLKAMVDGYEPQRCLQLATATGACCITAYDSLSGLLPFDQLLARIDAGWEKINT